jgi:hypothetical protein
VKQPGSRNLARAAVLANRARETAELDEEEALGIAVAETRAERSNAGSEPSDFFYSPRPGGE